MAVSEYTDLVNTNNGEQIPYTSVSHAISLQAGQGIITKIEYIRELSRQVRPGNNFSVQNHTKCDCGQRTREDEIYLPALQRLLYCKVHRNSILCCWLESERFYTWTEH